VLNEQNMGKGAWENAAKKAELAAAQHLLKPVLA
jgi:hypothetical protein